jgi:4-alpha-glucanotransferase
MEMTDRDGYEKPVEGVEAGKPVEEASKRAELGANV